MQPITYRVLVEGQQHFDCEHLSATLSVTTCTARHEHARQSVRLGLASACLRCPIGARHAASLPSASNLPATVTPDSGATCCRCGRHGLRILPSRGLCVSCSNREAEWRRGRNAKGAAPIEYVPPILRRVGVVMDGRPVWRMLESQSATEPLARARRAALVMHAEQPGAVCWCPERQAFEYRDKSNRPLAARLTGDRLTYAPAELHERPTPVTDSGIAMPPEGLQAWLALSGEAVGDEWRAQPVICDQCYRAPLQARKRAGHVECRCVACG